MGGVVKFSIVAVLTKEEEHLSQCSESQGMLRV